MTYQEAKELGEACGLKDPDEFILNVAIHAPSLFGYADIPKELKELYDTAREDGVI